MKLITGAVRVEATRPALRCALCHDGLGAGRERVCPDCGTSTHRECVYEAGACPTLGCVAAAGPATSPRPAPTRLERQVGVVQLGLIAGVASLLFGVVPGLIATGCLRHALLGGGGLVVVGLIYALLGVVVAGLCRLLERWRHSAWVPARTVSWVYLPLALAGSAGSVFAYCLIVALDKLMHGPMW